MSACTKLSRPSRSSIPAGMSAMVSAVMTPSATSPPKMLPKSRIASVTGLMNSSRNSIRPTNRSMTPARDALLEAREHEELAEVAAHAEAPEALVVEVEERHEREPDRDVDVARRRAERLDLAEERQETAPVREQDEQEERREQRDVPAGVGAAERDRPVLERLPDELDGVLEPPGDLPDHPARDDEHEQQHGHHDPHREDRVGDADVEHDEVDSGGARRAPRASRWSGQTTCGAGNSRFAMIRSRDAAARLARLADPSGTAAEDEGGDVEGDDRGTGRSEALRLRRPRAPPRAQARSRLARRPRWPVAGQSTPFLRIESAGVRRARVVSVLERREKPVDQSPDGHRSGRHAEEQAGQQQDRELNPSCSSSQCPPSAPPRVSTKRMNPISVKRARYAPVFPGPITRHLARRREYTSGPGASGSLG